MTDNEKRAHDISVAMLPVFYDANKSDAEINGIPDDSGKIISDFDVYETYTSVYNSALKAFNRDFPDGK